MRGSRVYEGTRSLDGAVWKLHCPGYQFPGPGPYGRVADLVQLLQVVRGQHTGAEV